MHIYIYMYNYIYYIYVMNYMYMLTNKYSFSLKPKGQTIGFTFPNTTVRTVLVVEQPARLEGSTLAAAKQA